MWMPLRAPKMKLLHLRVPALGLVAEVNARFHHLADGDRGVARGGLLFRGGRRGRCRIRSGFHFDPLRCCPPPVSASDRNPPLRRARTVVSTGVWFVGAAVLKERGVSTTNPRCRASNPANFRPPTRAGDYGTGVAVLLTNPRPLARRSHLMSPTAKPDIKPATGKLGILMPGMGAVATTFIAGVEAIRRGLGKPIGSLTQLGHDPARQAHRWPLAAHPRLRPAREARRHRVRRLGHLPRQRVSRRRARPACSTKEHLDAAEGRPDAIKPMTAGVRAGVRQEAHGDAPEEGQVEGRPRRAADRGHQALQEGQRLRSPGRWCGAARPRSTAAGGGPRDARDVRGGARARTIRRSRRRRSTPTRASRWACRTRTARRTCRSTRPR